ncbi:MAG: ATP-binding protein [Eubacteriaceae bacterium]|nr:ATP-binding protein [Eubacteriaceae bacterium]
MSDLLTPIKARAIGAGQKVLITGLEGVGKTTLAASFPAAIIIDADNGAKNFDFERLPAPKTWEEMSAQIGWAASQPQYKTIVIDTADAAERLCIASILKLKGWDGIESPGYGKGYTYMYESYARMLNYLELVANTGKNAVLTCHVEVGSFDQPDELGSYSRYNLKLYKKIAAMIKEWADLILFCNYESVIVNTAGSGSDAKYKATGTSKRVMHSMHSAMWDAKNRTGEPLPPKMDLGYGAIAHIFDKQAAAAPEAQLSLAEATPPEADQLAAESTANEMFGDASEADPWEGALYTIMLDTTLEEAEAGYRREGWLGDSETLESKVRAPGGMRLFASTWGAVLDNIANYTENEKESK